MIPAFTIYTIPGTGRRGSNLLNTILIEGRKVTDRAEWREWMSDLIVDGDGYAEVQREMGLVRMIPIRVSSGCSQGSFCGKI